MKLMKLMDWMGLIHPFLAVVVVFPLIGIVTSMAWQTRQRRIQTSERGSQSKIPPVVGKEHLKMGRWLTGAIVGITLIALAYSIAFKGVFKDLSSEKMPEAIFIILMFVATIASLVLLYQAKPNQPLWRGIFATLTGAGLVILGMQDGVFRRGYEWYVSHYYYGILASLLMVFSLAIVPDIYKSKKWRLTHTALNCIALLLFVGQGFTGSRDLLEIPLSWQSDHLGKCDWANQTCPDGSESNLPQAPTMSKN